MRDRRLPGWGLAALALALGSALAPGSAAPPARDAAEAGAAGPAAAGRAATGARAPARGGTEPGSPGPRPRAPTAARPAASTGGGACGAFPGAYQLPGAHGVVPAAWSGGGLAVPACGPVPGDGPAAPVYPYPGAPWTAGYQCVEFSERYLYDRYGVTMGIVTNGDQVAAHYAAGYPGLFMIVRNGTPHRAPAAGDVLSLSAAPGFDSDSGGHSAVVQSSSVDAAGNGSVTVVEENAASSGVAVLPVADWSVRYPGFRYVEWLTTAGLTVTSPHPPPLRPGRRYSFALTAAGGPPPYRWSVPPGTLPPGLTLSPAGLLAGTVTAAPAAPGTPPAGRTRPGGGQRDGLAPPAGWPVRVAVTDARGATAALLLTVPVPG
jgi:hypothetical protein